jgi:hypothetical protein
MIQPSRPVRRWLWRLVRDALVPGVLAWLIVIALHRTLYPSDLRAVAASTNGYGQVHLRIGLPGTHAGIPEPLLACGRVGNASLVYIRLLPNARARVGVEFWGLELDQGDEFSLPAADAVIDVTCSLPALYPPLKDSAWASVDAATQQRLTHEYAILVNGVVRLKGMVEYREPPHSPLYLGSNPLGGSFVSSRFSGTILDSDQKF